MSKICDLCGKKPVYGHQVSHAHNISSRRWMPNLQHVHAKVNGVSKKICVCTSCLKAGKVVKNVRGVNKKTTAATV